MNKIENNLLKQSGNLLIKRPLCLLLFSMVFTLTACNDKFDFGSVSGPVKKASDNQVVRGPAGVGSGGGVIIVENNGESLPNTRYEIFIEENGVKTSLQKGTTDNEGKVQLSESKLSADRISKLQNGDAALEVEVYNGNAKTAARGRVIIKTDNGNEELDVG
jgi:hypothetical protein